MIEEYIEDYDEKRCENCENWIENEFCDIDRAYCWVKKIDMDENDCCVRWCLRGNEIIEEMIVKIKSNNKNRKNKNKGDDNGE